MPVSGQEASSLVAKRGSADLCDMDWGFVSQRCGEDRGVERDGVDMYGEAGVEMYVEERDGEGEVWRLRLVFPGSICVL